MKFSESAAAEGKPHGIPSFRWVEYSHFWYFLCCQLREDDNNDLRWYIIPIWWLSRLRPNGVVGVAELQNRAGWLMSEFWDSPILQSIFHIIPLK